MANIQNAIDRIRKVQCPTGELEEKVAGILEGYEVAKREDVSLHREENFDRDNALGFRAEINTPQKISIRILARSGAEDYVAQVIEADEIRH